MREPMMIITDRGQEVDRIPFSQCPSFMLKDSASGKTRQCPSEDGCLGDGGFNRMYAARLLRERSARK